MKTEERQHEDSSIQVNPVNDSTLPAVPAKEDVSSRTWAATSPIVAASNSARALTKRKWGDLTVAEVVDNLAEKIGRVRRGDYLDMESMLVGQAQTLDLVFNELVEHGAAHLGKHQATAETYLRLAAKVQSNCRATILALGELRNPKSIVVTRQANIAHGPQQVNNGASAGQVPVAPPPANIPANELLEQQDGERLDFDKARAAGARHQVMEPVEQVQRPQNP